MHRGEIWLVNLNPSVGAEIRKSRPVIIVSIDEIGILPLRVIVPLTDWKEHYSKAPWMVLIEPNQRNGLQKRLAADDFQIRSISTQRLMHKIGDLEAKGLEKVIRALQVVVGFEV